MLKVLSEMVAYLVNSRPFLLLRGLTNRRNSTPFTVIDDVTPVNPVLRESMHRSIAYGKSGTNVATQDEKKIGSFSTRGIVKKRKRQYLSKKKKRSDK